VYFSKSLIISLESKFASGGIDVSKPNRVRTIIMLPFVAYVFFIGWCLSWANQKKQIHIESHVKKYNFGNL
jgi:hypothetical protein